VEGEILEVGERAETLDLVELIVRHVEEGQVGELAEALQLLNLVLAQIQMLQGSPADLLLQGLRRRRTTGAVQPVDYAQLIYLPVINSNASKRLQP
jgi:hypothetical protein